MPLSKLGYKDSPIETQAMPSGKGDNPLRYPSLCIYENLPDDIAGLDVEQKVKCEVVLRVSRKSVREENGKVRRDMEFDVLAIGNVSKPSKKSKEEFLGMMPEEREEYQKKSVMEDDPEDF